MPPTTRASTSKPSSTTDMPDITPGIIPNDVSNLGLSSAPIDDSNVLATVMESIKATNHAIDAISSRLSSHTTSIDDNTKKIATLNSFIKDVTSTITNLPDVFDSKLEIIQETLRSEFGTQFNSFGNRFTANMTSQRNDTDLCFKSHAATITRIIDDVVNISKNLSSLQETTLSKNDVEHIVVAKWQDELDPHIKSHYDFKTEVSTCLDYLDHTLKDTVTMLQNSSKLTGTTTYIVLHLLDPLVFIKLLQKIFQYQNCKRN